MGKYRENLTKGCARRWTKLTYDCYLRQCACSNCNLIPEHLIKQCQAKSSVVALIRNFGIPDKSLLQEESEEENNAESIYGYGDSQKT